MRGARRVRIVGAWIALGLALIVGEARTEPLLEADLSLERRDEKKDRVVYRITSLRSLVSEGGARSTSSMRLGCRSSDVLPWETTIAVGDTLGFAWIDQDGARGIKIPARGWSRSCRCAGKRDRLVTRLHGTFAAGDGEIERFRRVGGAPGILRVLSVGLLKGPRPPKTITLRMGWQLEDEESESLVGGR